MISEIHKYKYILGNDKYIELKKYLAHGNTTIYEHCIRVAMLGLYFSKIFNIKVDKKELIESSLLHDLYLYDWHNTKIKLHGLVHPKIASQNAKKFFNISDRVCKNIESHMWPLTILSIPKRKEAILLCIADKVSAITETISKYIK